MTNIRHFTFKQIMKVLLLDMNLNVKKINLSKVHKKF